MNDMTNPAAPTYFEIPKPRTKEVPTENFGKVTVTAPPPQVIEQIIGQFGNTQREDKPPLRPGMKAKSAPSVPDEDAPFRALVAECVVGEHGERFTVSLLARLPGQCWRDWLDMRAATMEVCGLSRESVGNT